MCKGNAALLLQDLDNIGSVLGWQKVVGKATGLDHSFNFQMIFDREGDAAVGFLLEDPFKIDISQPVELFDGQEEAPGDECVENLLIFNFGQVGQAQLQQSVVDVMFEGDKQAELLFLFVSEGLDIALDVAGLVDDPKSSKDFHFIIGFIVFTKIKTFKYAI